MDSALILVDSDTPAYDIEKDGKKLRVSPAEVYTHLLKYMHGETMTCPQVL